MTTRSPNRPDPTIIRTLARRVIDEEGLRATVADVDRVAVAEMWPETAALYPEDLADLLEAVADHIAELREARP